MELKQGDLENIILNAVWALEEEEKEKIDVRDVQAKIKTDLQSWAYTTVKTVLDRLVDKELLLRIKEGKKYMYRAVVTRDRAGEDAIKKLCKQYFRNDYKEMIDCAKKIERANRSAYELASVISV